MASLAQASELIRPVIEAAGYYLEELSISPAGKRRIVTVVVDGDSHLSLDQVTAITKSISDLLENSEVLGQTPYTLEVTSPGLDRPLTLPRHWKKNEDRLVRATLTDGDTVQGRIGESTDEGVEIDQSKYPFAQIKRAVLEVEFNPKGQK